MSIYSRDYMREDGPSGRSGGPRSWSVVTWLLVVNVGVFLLQTFLFYRPDTNALALSLEALGSGHLWTLVTYQFAHHNLLHLLGNMLGLFFLGRMLLNLTSPAHVLKIYLFGGLAGGVLQLAFSLVMGQDPQIVGASASVLAIVIAVATLIPQQSIQLLLFFILPISLTLRQIAIFLIAVNALTLFFGLSSGPADGVGIAAMAHFGGMLLGWAYIRFWLPRNPRGKGGARPRRKSLGKKFGVRILREGETPRAGRFPRVRDRGREGKKTFVTEDVDAILDKINAEGFQSLTAEERRLLERGSRKLSDRIDRDS
ncbi:MAG: rhomboid family intramembrane serine protease [Verrucomicrobiales bacterium]